MQGFQRYASYGKAQSYGTNRNFMCVCFCFLTVTSYSVVSKEARPPTRSAALHTGVCCQPKECIWGHAHMNFINFVSSVCATSTKPCLYYDCLNGPIRLIYSRLISSTFT